MFAEGVELGAGELAPVSAERFLRADDDGAGGEIAEALAMTGEPAGGGAREVEDGKGVDGPQEIPDDDLGGGGGAGVAVHDAEAEEAFAEGLAVPPDFEDHAVGGGEDEIGEGEEAADGIGGGGFEGLEDGEDERAEGDDGEEVND